MTCDRRLRRASRLGWVVPHLQRLLMFTLLHRHLIIDCRTCEQLYTSNKLKQKNTRQKSAKIKQARRHVIVKMG